MNTGALALVPAGPAAAPSAAGPRAAGRVGVVGRVLGLGVDADPAAGLLATCASPARSPPRSVGISNRPLNCCGRSANGWTARRVLISASVKSQAKKPVSATPSTTGRLAVGELGMAAHVGGRGDVRLVARDQVAVLRGHEVGLDVVGAEPDRERVALQRVVGQVAGSAAVPDDQRRLLAGAPAVSPCGRHRDKQQAHPHERSSQCSACGPHGGELSCSRGLA